MRIVNYWGYKIDKLVLFDNNKTLMVVQNFIILLLKKHGKNFIE